MVENNSRNPTLYDIVLFDGVCNLCNHAVTFIIDRDPQKRYKFASLQSATGIAFLKKYNLPTDTMDSLVLIRDNKTYIKSTGALFITKKLSGLWPLFFIFIIIPASFRDLVYTLIANNRYKIFGKSNSCRYPSEETKTRFLEF